MSSIRFHRLVELCERTHKHLQLRAARSVDLSLVARNWLFGYYIMEFEQKGAERSELYGKKLITRLASSLAEQGLKGTSATNLRKFRAFYAAYPEIQQTLSVESLPGPSDHPWAIEETAGQLATSFKLGWSHYVVLLTISNNEERRFYEIEASANSWSVRELERQINSALYERLMLSRDKEKARMLAEQGLVIEQARDVIKNPVILEFLSLREEASYTESDPESGIIDKLGQFLLELGK